jgi:hypothetical protein
VTWFEARHDYCGAQLAKLATQDIAQLVEQLLGRNDGVLANAVFQQVAAGAAGHERRDEDVRVEK